MIQSTMVHLDEATVVVANPVFGVPTLDIVGGDVTINLFFGTSLSHAKRVTLLDEVIEALLDLRRVEIVEASLDASESQAQSATINP